VVHFKAVRPSLISQAEAWNRLHTLFTHVEDPLLLVYGADLEILEANPAAHSLLATRGDLLVGKRIEELADKSCPLSPAMLRKSQEPRELVLCNGNGESCLVEALLLRVPENVDTHYLRLKDLGREQERRTWRRQLQFSLVQMTGALEPEYILHFLAQTFVMQFHGMAATVFSTEDGNTRCKASAFANGRTDVTIPLKREALILLGSEMTILSSRNFPEERWCADPGKAAAEGWQCFYGSPLVHGERCLGALTLVCAAPLDDEHLEAMEVICGQAAMAMHHAQQLRIARHRQKRVEEELENLEWNVRVQCEPRTSVEESQPATSPDAVVAMLRGIEKRLKDIREVVNAGS